MATPRLGLVVEDKLTELSCISYPLQIQVWSTLSQITTAGMLIQCFQLSGRSREWAASYVDVTI